MGEEGVDAGSARGPYVIGYATAIGYVGGCGCGAVVEVEVEAPEHVRGRIVTCATILLFPK